MGLNDSMTPLLSHPLAIVSDASASALQPAGACLERHGVVVFR